MIRGHTMRESIIGTIISVLVLGYAATASAQSVNLIANGSFESGTTAPTGWVKEYWGSPVPTFTYPAAGNGGSRAVSITLGANSTGDANWQTTAVAVTPGSTYTYSTWYNSNVATEIDAEYTSTGGATSYVWIADIPSSGGTWKQLTVSFTVPSGIAKANVYHLIFNKGTLSIDDVSLVKNGATTPPPAPPPPPPPPPTPTPTPSPVPPPIPTPPPPPPAPSLTFTAAPTSITAGQSSTLTWTSTNTANCSASGAWSGTKALSGSQIVSPTANATYTLLCTGTGSGTISKSATVTVTAATPPPAPPPPPPPPSSTQFSEGMVTLSFDDSWLSQYQNVFPVLQSAGIKGTFFFTTQPVQEGWSDYMTPSQVQAIANAGHEVAGHTITHPHLPQMSSSQITNELVASKNYLQNLTGKAVTSFAYPYGEMNSTVKALVQQAGYTSARGTDDETQNTAKSDKFALKSSCIENTETFAQVKAQIDAAKANKQWYIICIHNVRNVNDQYTLTPAFFQQIVNYIKSSGIKVVTEAEGRALMAN